MGNIEQGGIGGKGRYDGGFDDLYIGDINIFGNNKSSRTHNGRGQLPVRAGSHFNSRGLSGRIADFFHHGDGKRSGCDDIGNAGAGYHAGQPAAQNCGLGRSAFKPAQKAQCQLDEITPAPGLV